MIREDMASSEALDAAKMLTPQLKVWGRHGG